jgi:NTE family protein
MGKDGIPRIGVAFSGGGVRGLAHLGVLQVMEEAEVPVDFVAGTSMGGLVAGLYAAGVPLQELIAFGTRTGIIDLASPDRGWRGLFGHKKMVALLADLLGSKDITFEDLDIPAAVIAADVERGKMVILDQGPLIPALMATSAVPIVFAPVYHQERWLVDGGVVNNFPVDIVRQMGADRVLGVNVPPSVRLSLSSDEQEKGLSPRGLRFLGSHALDWKLPFLIAEASVDIPMQVVNQTRLALCPPDVLLEIHLPNVGIFTSDDNARIIEAGRRVAMDNRAKLVQLKTKPFPPPWRSRLASTMARVQRAWTAFQEPEYPAFPQPAGPGSC